MANLNVGDQAPDFEAVNDQGETVRLTDYRGKRVVLYFYPKDNTPGCTTQACNFRDAYEGVRQRNAVVLGVSPDSAGSHQKFRSKYQLPFPLLVDQDYSIARKFGAFGEKKKFGLKYEGVIRSHFVIDESGTIVDAEYDVKANESANKALNSL